jgi:hypothetical protein
VATVDCRRCNETLDQLKTADWDRFDAQQRAAEAADFNRRFTIWVKEQFTERRIRFQFPSSADLARMYPNVPITSPPKPPAVSDPRVPAQRG